MPKILPLAAVVAVWAYPPICSAADAKWTAVSTLERGTSCGVGQADWQVDIQGNTMRYTHPATNRSYTIDLKTLQPDGSGKVTTKDDKNRDFYLTFEPGSGPRVFRVTNSINACAYLMAPKK